MNKHYSFAAIVIVTIALIESYETRNATKAKN